MLRIEPIDAETCSQHAGRPVCAVLKGGAHYYGYLDRVENGKLHLHNAIQGEGTLSVSAMKKRPASKTNTQEIGFPKPYAPYSYPGAGTVAVDLTLMAFLFALPFFII